MQKKTHWVLVYSNDVGEKSAFDHSYFMTFYMEQMLDSSSDIEVQSHPKRNQIFVFKRIQTTNRLISFHCSHAHCWTLED